MRSIFTKLLVLLALVSLTFNQADATTTSTLRLLSAGGAVSDSDLFLTRQGSDTKDKSITATQLSAFGGTTVFTCDGTTDQTSAISTLLSTNGSYLFKGTCKITGIAISNVTLTLDMAEGASFQPYGTSDIGTLIHFTTSNITFKRFRLNGLGLVQKGVLLTQGTLTSPNSDIILTNLGYPVDVAPDGVFGFYVDRVTKIELGSFEVGSGFTTVGNGVCNSANFIGSIRGLYIIGSGYADIKNFRWVEGSTQGTDSGVQIDPFQANTGAGGNVGGIIHNAYIRYNGRMRRTMKFQAGKWVVEKVDIRPGTDFVAADGSGTTTSVGTDTLNGVDWASSGTKEDSSLDVLSGYIDCSGFTSCFGNSGTSTVPVRGHSGLIIKGPILSETRNATICNGSITGGTAAGFYSGSGGDGSGLDGVKIVNFGRPVLLQGPHSYVINSEFVDPVTEVAEVGSSTAKDGMVFANNRVITTTSGYISGSLVTVINAKNALVYNNSLIENGNTTHGATFVNTSNAGATGYAWNNFAPSGTTGFNAGSSSIIILNQKGVQNVVGGGTGIATATAHGVLIGNGTSALNVTTAGTSGYVLTSNGASADPTFQASTGVPGGSDGQIQFNSGSTFKGVTVSGGLTFDPVAGVLANTSAGGNVTNSGTVTSRSIPVYADSTGTLIAFSSAAIDTSGNVTGFNGITYTSGGRGTQMMIPLVSGRMYSMMPFGATFSTASATAMATNTEYATLQVAPAAFSLHSVGIRTASTNASSGAAVKACVYAADGTNGRPSTLLGQTTSGTSIGDSATSTDYSLTLDSDTAIPSGPYWIALLHTFTTTGARVVNQGFGPAANMTNGAATHAAIFSSTPTYAYTMSQTYASGCASPFSASPSTTTNVNLAPAYSIELH